MKIVKLPINRNGKLHVERQMLEEVCQIAYPGSYIDQDVDTRKEVRIAKAISIFKNVKNTWYSNVISIKRKLKYSIQM